MTPAIRLLRAANASALTGSGTNTWLLGQGSVAVIDPGPDLPGHLEAILAALGPSERITQILVTHAHLDHSGLAPSLAAATGAPVAAFGTATDGRSETMQRLAAEGLGEGGEGLDRTFRPDHRLSDGERLEGEGWQITVLHMPGHLGGHLCFACDDVLFSGDHVMGWSTSLIAPPDGDMGDYMASLRRLSGMGFARALPGHGAPIEDPARRIDELIRHRKGREAEILAALTPGPATPAQLTAQIYANLPLALQMAARGNVLAHLIDLHEKGQVITLDRLGPDTRFSLG